MKKKIENATSKNEKIQIAKAKLDEVYDSYSRFTGMIPEVKDRIKELENQYKNLDGVAGKVPKDVTEKYRDKIKRWKEILNNLENVLNKPKAMKLFYAKKVTKQCKQMREKYPEE